MALFKMVRDALPPSVVADAHPLIAQIATRTDGKYSFVSNETTPQERERLLAIVERFLAGPAAELFRTVHGVEPCICLSITTVRFQAAASRHQLVDWHLDLNFVGDDKPFLVSWTALEDVGVERVALDVCVPAGQSFDIEAVLRERARHERDGVSLTFSDGDLNRLLGAHNWTCRSVTAPAGAAALFDQYILHRSQILPTATKDRHSIEFRMMDLDNLPARQRAQQAVYARRRAEGGLALTIAGKGEPVPLPVEDFKTLRIV